MIILLILFLLAMWCAGAIFVTAITGWEINKINDLVKIIFWPISIFICRQ